MGTNASNTVGPFTIVESELRLMAGNAAAWGRLETCFGLYGFFSRRGNGVILLATPPSERAIHRYDFCQEDLEHFLALDRYLRELGLDYEGTSHSHHEFVLTGPSSRDLQSIRSIVRKNDLPCFYQLTLNLPDQANGRAHPSASAARRARGVYGLSRPDRSARGYPLGPARRAEGEYTGRVTVHAHVYRNDDRERLEEIPIRVLPGTSPYRAVLESASDPRARWVRFDTPPFPMSRIELEPPVARETRIPSSLEAQWLKLPEAALLTSETFPTDGYFVFAATTPGGDRLRFLHEDASPYRLRYLFRAGGHGDTLEDITQVAERSSRDTSVAGLYEWYCRSEAANAVPAAQSPNDSAERVNGKCKGPDAETEARDVAEPPVKEEA